jgi:AraC-like DNA-binding protein
MEIVLLFTPAVFHIGWQSSGGKPCEQETRGPHICVIAPGLPHECRLEGDAELLVLYVECSLLRRVMRKKIRGVVVSESAQHDVVIWMLASLLRHLCTAQLRPSARTIDSIGGEFACWLVDLLQKSDVAAQQSGGGLTPVQRERVMSFMQANMKHDIHVVDLAKQTGHGVSHFADLFTNTFGRSPYHYLKEIRLLKGYEMLLTGDYLAKEVALAVGYSNPDHFSKVFHEFCGYSPRELLRRIRRAAVKPPA